MKDGAEAAANRKDEVLRIERVSTGIHLGEAEPLTPGRLPDAPGLSGGCGAKRSHSPGMPCGEHCVLSML